MSRRKYVTKVCRASQVNCTLKDSLSFVKFKQNKCWGLNAIISPGGGGMCPKFTPNFCKVEEKMVSHFTATWKDCWCWVKRVLTWLCPFFCSLQTSVMDTFGTTGLLLLFFLFSPFQQIWFSNSLPSFNEKQVYFFKL